MTETLTPEEFEVLEIFMEELCKRKPRDVLIIMWNKAKELGLTHSCQVYSEAIKKVSENEEPLFKRDGS